MTLNGEFMSMSKDTRLENKILYIFWKHNYNEYFIIFPFCFFCLISVSPESVVIPIVSCIFGFPLLALLVICCLRKRAKLARERDRRRNYDLQDHAVSLVRFSPIHRLCESDKINTKKHSNNFPLFINIFNF